MISLSVDLRPRSLSQFIGHEDICQSISKRIESGSVPRAFMFSGPAGVGKTTLANIVARLVQQADTATDPDSFDITELNAADKNSVDDMRSLIESCGYRPFSGRFKVLILNEVQQLTKPAQNVLLAPMEDKGSSTIFILTTTEPDKIIQPLQDRCTRFSLRPFVEVQTIELIKRASKALGVPYKDEFVVMAVSSGINSPRVLLQSYEKYVSGVSLVDCFEAAAQEPLYKDIAHAVIRGNWPAAKSRLAQIQTGDARAMRAIVSGLLRYELLACDVGVKADAISACLVGLGNSVFEDGIAWSATCGLLYKCTKMIGGSK